MTLDEIYAMTTHQLNCEISRRKGWTIESEYPDAKRPNSSAFLVRQRVGAVEAEKMPNYVEDATEHMRLMREKRFTLRPKGNGWECGDLVMIGGKTPGEAIARAWLALE